MKVTVPLVVVLILASTIGYLVGTESGRQRRDVIMVRLGRTGPIDDAESATDEAGAA